MRKIWIIFLFCLLSPKYYTQYTNWTNYMYTNSISSIVEDGNYFWIGTNGGVVKFDKITGDKSIWNKTNSGYPSYGSMPLAIDETGKIWCTHSGEAGNSGIIEFDGINNWTIYNHTNSGLPGDDRIRTLQIDANGIMWIATAWAGLVRYDGINWINYNSTNSGLQNNHLEDMYIDEQNVIWLTTQRDGIAKFDGNNWVIYNTNNSGLHSDWVREITKDKNGNMWFGTVWEGVVKFDGSNWTVYNTENSGLPADEIGEIFGDSKGNVWMSTHNSNESTFQLSKFDGIDWIIYNENNTGLPANIIYGAAYYEDENGNLWLGTQGLIKFDGINWSVYDLSSNGLTGGIILELETNSYNNIWLATYRNENLHRFDGNNWTLYNSDNSGLPEADIGRIAVDKENNLWIFQQRKLTKYNGNNWTTYEHDMYGATNMITDLNGNVWFGNYYGLTKFNGSYMATYDTLNSGLPINDIAALALSTDNILWIGTDGGGLVKYDGSSWIIYNTYNSQLPSDFVRELTVDKLGNVWIHTSWNGSNWEYNLTKFDGTNWTIYNQSNSNLPNGAADALTADSDGNIWLGIWPRGLVKFDGSSWEVYNYLNSGMPTNLVHTITVDNDRIIWVGTSNGLARFDYYSGGGDSYIYVLLPNGGEEWEIGDNKNINWTSLNVENINIKYSTDSGNNWLPIATNINANVGNYTWNVPNIISAHCKVRISDYTNENLYDISDNEFSIGIPRTPSNLVALAQGSSSTLTWDDNSSNEEGFVIERKVKTSGNWAQIGTVGSNINNYNDSELTTNDTIYYRIFAFVGTNKSQSSNEYYAITMTAPSELNATTISVDKINLSWSDNALGETGYKIERRTTGNWIEIADLQPDITNYECTNLTSGTKYFFRIRAYANSTTPIPHYSDFSNESSATTEGTIQEGFFLGFPLAGQNPYTAGLNSVFDHSMSSFYVADDFVIAFSGEMGEKSIGYLLDGYAQKSGEKFIVNGNYTAAGYDPKYLFYDGHPGVDYRAGTGTLIYAPASGEVIIPNSDPVNGNPELFNTIMIKHNDEYATWYLHCNKHLINSGLIERGIPFAEVGTVGTTAPHLHFELRKNGIPVDPYGWQGIGNDPYTKEQSEFVWDISTDKSIWDFSDSFEMWRTRDAINKGINQGLGGKWVIDPGSDPGIISPVLNNVDADLYIEIEIRMAVNENGQNNTSKGIIYFATENKVNFSDNQPVEFDSEVILDGSQYIYIANMKNSKDWKGKVTAIRIDPIENGDPILSDDNLFLDYVRLVSANKLTIIGNSPIDISLTDPNGLVISKYTMMVKNASYIEEDIDADGEKEDVIFINNPTEGKFKVSVIAQAGANLTDTYSLISIVNNDTNYLAHNVKISDIPNEPYTINYYSFYENGSPPNEYILFQNHPNPFNSVTNMRYSIPEDQFVSINIYDILGREIVELVDEMKTRGTHQVQFNSVNLASGVYIYQIIAGEFKESKKMVLLR